MGVVAIEGFDERYVIKFCMPLLAKKKWRKKRRGKRGSLKMFAFLGRVQAKTARFEYFQSSHKSARCDEAVSSPQHNE